MFFFYRMRDLGINLSNSKGGRRQYLFKQLYKELEQIYCSRCAQKNITRRIFKVRSCEFMIFKHLQLMSRDLNNVRLALRQHRSVKGASSLLIPREACSEDRHQYWPYPTSWSKSTKFDARGQWSAAPRRWWRRPECPWTSSSGQRCSSSSPSWSLVQSCPDLAAAENFQVFGAGDDQVSSKIHRA